MEHKLASGIIRVTYAGQTFEQITTEDGIISYSINGQPVDKATWDERQNSVAECAVTSCQGAHSVQKVGCASI